MRAFLTLYTVCISSRRTICAFLRYPALLCASLRLYTLLDYCTRYGGRSRIHTLELTSPVPPLLLCAPLRSSALLCAPLRSSARYIHWTRRMFLIYRIIVYVWTLFVTGLNVTY